MPQTRRLFSFLRAYRLWVILAPIMMAIEVGADLLQPRLVERIIDQGIAQNDIVVVRNTAFMMLGVALVGLVGGVLCGVFAIRASQGFGADLRGTLFRKVQTFSFSNIDDLETGSLITRLTNDVTQLVEMVGMMLRIMVRAPLLLFGSLILATITSPRLALLFVVLIPLILVIIGVVMRLAYPLFRLVQKRLDGLNTVMQENLAGVRVVRVFARANHEEGRFHTANADLRETTLKVMRYMVAVMPLLMFLVNMGIVAAYWFGGNLINTGDLQVGQLVAFTNYMLQSLFGIMMISMLIMRFARAEASAGRVNEVLDTVPTIVPAPIPIERARRQGKVEFRDVSFAHEVDGTLALQHVSFTAEPGEELAILGATGSGKSTLVHLIPRFHDTTQGEVLIDGVNVRDYDEPTLRSLVAIALQESILFSGTVRDNIRYGRPTATDDEVEAAAQMAQAWDFISALPAGLDSMIGQRGVNLSGGQKQRLAIARALLITAPILILDDSTSAVDVATEARIQQALAGVSQTRIIVAQRISAVLNATKIIVLEAGEKIAEGTHPDLLATSPVYRDIYESQMESEGEFDGAA